MLHKRRWWLFYVCMGVQLHASQPSTQHMQEPVQAKRIPSSRPAYVGNEPVPPTRVHLVHVDTRFESLRKRCNLMVVYFYELDKQERTIKTPRWDRVNTNFEGFHRASRLRRYVDAGVCFIGVNLTRDNLMRYKEEFRLRDKDSIVLFRNGVPYGKEDLIGAFTEKDIRGFVDDYFSDFIEDELDKRLEQERRQEQASTDECANGNCTVYSRPRLGVYSYSWPGYWYGYPYNRWWYGYPGWYGAYGYPGVGFGVSFGI